MSKIKTSLMALLTFLAINTAGAQVKSDSTFDALLKHRPVFKGEITREQNNEILKWENKVRQYFNENSSDKAQSDTLTNPTPTVQPVDNYSGNFEWVQGTKPEHTYGRTNTFYGLPADISGYNWTEFYVNGGTTIFGRNTLSKDVTSVAGINVGLDNQLIYGTGMPARIGVGAHLSVSPIKDSFVKGYFTPVLIDTHGKEVPNTSITGVYAEATVTPSLKVSGFYEVNLSSKDGPETSYGEGNLEYMANDNVSISWNPSFTNKGSGKLEPQTNQRFTVKYTFK
jgi:hypothetical protein